MYNLISTQSPSLPVTGASRLRRHLLTVIELLEVTLVAAVGVPALFAEQMAPSTLSSGLSLLALPSLLRLVVAGYLAPTLTIWPLLVLVLLSAVTVQITPAWVHTWPELVRLLWGIALCVMLINWLNPLQALPAGGTARRHLSPRLLWATIAFFGLGLALTTVGLLVMGPIHKIAWLDGWLARLPQLSVGGFSGFNPNRVGGVAVLLAPLAVALTVGRLLPHHPTWLDWVSWLVTKSVVTALALFFVGAVLLTQSRAAWLALACAVLVMLSLLGRRGWLLLAALLAMGSIGVAAIGPDRLLHTLTVYDPRQISADAPIQDRNLAGRLILWQRALHGLADAPLTGMGLAAFEAVSQQPYPALPAFKPDPDMSHVHNIVLQVGLDFGAPGIIVFVGLLAMMAWLLWRLVRRSQAPSALHTWSLGLLGCLVAYLVYHMLDAITLGARPSVIVWFLFGLAIGAGEWAQAAAQQPVHHRPQAGAPLPAVVAGPAETIVMAPGTPAEWTARAWAATTRSDEP